MFEELYAPLPDPGRYLRRMGLPEDARPDLKILDAIILAHKRTVPFENLDIYDAQTDISLAIEAMYDKIVVRQRGGYCFELNTLFMSLLESLGFDCYPVAARVIWNRDCYMPETHRATIVTIDGVRYFCDVGFGGPTPDRALRLDDTEPQETEMGSFVFGKAPDGDTIIYKVADGGLEHLLKFSEKPLKNVDFLALNEYQSKNPNSGFKIMRMINITTPTGSIAITGDRLRIHKDGAVTETHLDTQEKMAQALREHFGIHVDFPFRLG